VQGLVQRLPLVDVSQGYRGMGGERLAVRVHLSGRRRVEVQPPIAPSSSRYSRTASCAFTTRATARGT
jgi:hypothetical protein